MFYDLDDQETLTFQERLENSVGSKLRLKINDNRSTMLSVKWDPDCTKVSLHHATYVVRSDFAFL